ncbi:MFS transporter [Paenibacillus radicis (ex Gao et al. 2016)]|uniref:MFS transporter n=1 Tax=Paenibacillus radicis (ex Gao et al. 2016) TaxID=1737354 RepID=A0A917H3Q1_9BACL|nr:MFS transporter [Paenibacillus radicis (ex Gao et al. 2016)]GGG66957.1 MFS transporter [Paenibacillus radicis (ex Gao et al. 2016)]
MRILAVYYFVWYCAVSVLIPYTSLYFSEQGYTSTKVGLILSLWAMVSVVAQPVMGIINDRIGNPRTIMILCAVVSPLLGMGFQWTSGIAAVLVLSVFFAWFQSSGGPIGDAIAVEIASQRGFSFGSVRLWGALSYAIGTFATGILYEKYGYDNIFNYYLVFSLLICVVIVFLPSAKLKRSRAPLFGQIGEVMRNKPYIVFIVTSMLMMMSANMNMTFLPLYFKEMNFDKSWIGSAFAIAALIEVPMFWVAVKLSKRMGRYQLLCLASAIYGVQYFMMFAFESVSMTLSLQLLNGVAFAFIAGTSVEVVQSLSSEGTKATQQTLYTAISWGLGGIIGSALGGVLVDGLGAHYLYLILCGLCTIAAVLFFAFRRHQQQVAPTVAA